MQNNGKEQRMTKNRIGVFCAASEVALPGGIGTLDEIFHVLAAGSLGYHDKQVILYNVDGFWNGLLEFLHELEVRQFIHHPLKERLKVADTFEQLISFLTD